MNESPPTFSSLSFHSSFQNHLFGFDSANKLVSICQSNCIKEEKEEEGIRYTSITQCNLFNTEQIEEKINSHLGDRERLSDAIVAPKNLTMINTLKDMVVAGREELIAPYCVGWSFGVIMIIDTYENVAEWYNNLSDKMLHVSSYHNLDPCYLISQMISLC